MKILDPGNSANKIAIKASITDAIAKQIAGFSRDEIALRVEETYERFLGSASIRTHIPSLTAGLVRRAMKASRDLAVK